ncbi:MAG: hypothetical protein ACR2K1_10335 [Saprospiraceae bacterium]
MTRILFLLATSLLLSGRMIAQGIVWNGACTDRLFCLNAGSCTQGNVFLVEKATTSCSNPMINYSYRIDLDNNGFTDIMSTEDTVNAPFALGTHRVIWRATDNCANQSTCEYLFTIRDCNPPNLLCINGLTQNLDAPFCTASFSANQFILNLNDNCTPKNQIQIGLRLASDTSSAFPTVQSLTFDSCDVGIQFIQIRVRDGGGLQNSCNSYVLVQDASNECSCDTAADVRFQGCVRSAGGQRLTNYYIRANLAADNAPNPASWMVQESVTDSCFSVPLSGIPFGNNYTATVRAFRNDGPLVGFTTFDLLQISKHILGIESFSSFYQMLAADINNSKTVTTFDIVEGRKVLLGISDTFLAVPSWRLIRPLADPGPLLQWDVVRDTYQIQYNNLLGDISTPGLHFIGVKSGDVNLSAASIPEPEDRSADPILLALPEGQAAPGELVSIPFKLLAAARLSGWQLSVSLDPELWDFEELSGILADHYAWDERTNTLRALWYDPLPRDYRSGDALCTLYLRARVNARYAEGISLAAGSLLHPEAYTAEGAARPLALAGSGVLSGDQIFPPRPNPFSRETTFPIELVEAGPVEIEIRDVIGRLRYRQVTSLPRGAHNLALDAAQIAGAETRVWTYRIRAGGAVRAGVLIGAE